MVDTDQGFDLSQVNNKTLEVSLTKSTDGSPIDLVWEPVSFIDTSLVLQLNFTNPIEVSQSEEKDLLEITIPKVDDSEMFVPLSSKKFGAYFYLEERTLQKGVRKQLKDDSLSNLMKSNQDTVSGTMNGMIAGQVFMNFFISASLVQVIGMLNSLQIMCF